MKILVTGGAGFIGSNFIHYVLNASEYKDWHIINLDKLTYAGNLENLKDIRDNKRYKFIRADIADYRAVEDLVERYCIDVVVNFAAETHVDRSILESLPFIKTNIVGVGVLFEVARKYGIKKFIQISTDEVYGSLCEGDERFTENSPLLPNSPYAASKAAADMLARAYFKTYNLPVIITRSSNNFGPYQFPEKLIPLTISHILKDKKIPIYGDGRNIRDWLYVEDNCRAISLMIERGNPGSIYNIGGGCELSNIEVVKRICRFMEVELDKCNLERLITFVEDRPGHDFRYALSFEKAREELSWEPRYSFDEALKSTIGWYLDNTAWIEHAISGEYRDFYKKWYDSRLSD